MRIISEPIQHWINIHNRLLQLLEDTSRGLTNSVVVLWEGWTLINMEKQKCQRPKWSIKDSNLMKKY